MNVKNEPQICSNTLHSSMNINVLFVGMSKKTIKLKY